MATRRRWLDVYETCTSNGSARAGTGRAADYGFDSHLRHFRRRDVRRQGRTVAGFSPVHAVRRLGLNVQGFPPLEPGRLGRLAPASMGIDFTTPIGCRNGAGPRAGSHDRLGFMR
jgi:hypothetical protein